MSPDLVGLTLRLSPEIERKIAELVQVGTYGAWAFVAACAAVALYNFTRIGR